MWCVKVGFQRSGDAASVIMGRLAKLPKHRLEVLTHGENSPGVWIGEVTFGPVESPTQAATLADQIEGLFTGAELIVNHMTVEPSNG